MDLSVLNSGTIAIVLAFLLSLSEVLALIPSIKSNSIFELVVNSLKKIKEFVSK